jgi:hypothetical protein
MGFYAVIYRYDVYATGPHVRIDHIKEVLEMTKAIERKRNMAGAKHALMVLLDIAGSTRTVEAKGEALEDMTNTIIAGIKDIL